MKRDVQAVLLVLLGGALLRLSLSGAYLNYVKQSLGIFVSVSGVILVSLGIWGAFSASARPEEPEHHHGGGRTAWLLLLPVLTIFLIAPPPLGAFAADRSASNIPPPASVAGLPVLPKPDPVEMQVSDYAVRAVWDDGKTLVGRTVQLTGFVTKAPGGGWYLTRLQIACCAADATPFRLKAVGAPSFPVDTWVHVVGSWIPGGGTQRDDAIPNIKVDSATPVARPANPYE